MIHYCLICTCRASALFPTNVDQLKDLNVALEDVKDEQFALILISFCAVYIFKQSFAIPGSVIMVIIIIILWGNTHYVFGPIINLHT